MFKHFGKWASLQFQSCWRQLAIKGGADPGSWNSTIFADFSEWGGQRSIGIHQHIKNGDNVVASEHICIHEEDLEKIVAQMREFKAT